MNCPSCGKVNRQERRFCASCGKQMGKCCRRCGFSNFSGEVYCGGCGVSFQSSKQLSPDKTSTPGNKSREISGNNITNAAFTELNNIREKAGKPETEESTTVSQEDIERMLRKN